MNDALGACDKWAIQAVVDEVSEASPTLRVQIEHSCDQRTWASKNVSTEIPATPIGTTASTPVGSIVPLPRHT